MHFDNRSTNGKPQTHPFRLGSKKRIEDPLNILCLQPMTSVTHRNNDRTGVILSRGNLQLAGLLARIASLAFRIKSDYLLQLDSIS